MFIHTKTPPPLPIMGHSTQGRWEARGKKQERKKRFEAENDIRICGFQKCRAAQAGSLESTALSTATSVNTSPLNILAVFSLKSNSGKHQRLHS